VGAEQWKPIGRLELKGNAPDADANLSNGVTVDVQGLGNGEIRVSLEALLLDSRNITNLAQFDLPPIKESSLGAPQDRQLITIATSPSFPHQPDGGKSVPKITVTTKLECRRP
jgi:hypothetical protein